MLRHGLSLAIVWVCKLVYIPRTDAFCLQNQERFWPVRANCGNNIHIQMLFPRFALADQSRSGFCRRMASVHGQCSMTMLNICAADAAKCETLVACIYPAYHQQESPDIIVIIIIITFTVTVAIFITSTAATTTIIVVVDIVVNIIIVIVIVIIGFIIMNIIVISIIVCLQTPRAPPLPVAAFLSPILWRLNNPDKFDMYSVGVLFLQMVFPNLRR